MPICCGNDLSLKFYSKEDIMKKVLAIFLSALLICMTVAPIASAANLGIDLLFNEGKYKEIALEENDTTISETTFTVALRAPRGIKNLVGFNLYVEYDPSILSVAEAGLAKDANGKINFNGLLVSGQKSGSNNQYAMAWIPGGDGKGVSKNTAKDLVYITFNVINTNKKQTSLNFYIDEFRTDDSKDNDVTSTILYETQVIDFAFPVNTPPAVTEPTEDSDTSTINTLLQMIRDMLNGNGVTFADFADAIANTLGNAEITDIVEQLVDGDVDISNGFIGILAGLGLDFGSFEDILNTIIDFIAGLFGGDSADNTTNAGGSNDSTTSAGSSSGSEKTGDAGIALAATVCVLSSVGFVLTRKKKEII